MFIGERSPEPSEKTPVCLVVVLEVRAKEKPFQALAEVLYPPKGACGVIAVTFRRM
jgi:hypothetical protein